DAWPLLAGGTVQVSPWLVSADFLLVQAVAAHGGGLLLGPQGPMLYEPEGKALEPVLAGHVGIEHTFRAARPHPSQSDSRTRGALEQIQEMLNAFPEE